MVVNDSEPRYRFVDSNGNIVGGLYFDTTNEKLKMAFDDGTEVTLASK